MVVIELPIYKIGGKYYYRDVRLGEYRNIDDPSDTKDINIPNEELEYPSKEDAEMIMKRHLQRKR